MPCRPTSPMCALCSLKYQTFPSESHLKLNPLVVTWLTRWVRSWCFISITGECCYVPVYSRWHVCSVYIVRYLQVSSIASLFSQCCAQWSVSNSRVSASPALSGLIIVKLCTSTPSFFCQTLSWGVFTSRELPKRIKGWRGHGELGTGSTVTSPSLTCFCCWGRVETEIKLLAGSMEALCWPLSALLSGCCLGVILETLGWLKAPIREALLDQWRVKEIAFISAD